jgi:leader peptidase (prepilin peptidase)/N-methyltransferase
MIYLGFYARYGLGMQFIAFSFLFSILLVVFFIDIDHRIIPDGLVITALLGGAAVFVINIFTSFDIYGDRLWWNPLLGILPGSVFLLIMALIGGAIYKSDEAMGMGDVKVFAPIGMFLGWRMCMLALILAVLFGGIAGIILILFRKKKRRDTIPFGPYIVAGAYLTAMWGWNIVNSYFSLS